MTGNAFLSSKGPFVSVVIITRDRPESLHKCVRSILNNTFKDIEIIIFDNGSEESKAVTRNFLSSIEGQCPIKYIESLPKGFAEMRQTAINHAAGEIIMSIDDDCVARVDAIAQLVNHFHSDKQIGIVGGQIINVGFAEDTKLKGRGKIGPNGLYQNVENIEEADVFGSANMSIRRSAFEAVGGYDLFFADGLEEADLCLAIKKQHYKIVYDPAVVIIHTHVPVRFRRRWRNMDTLRLYLFFKYLRPANWADWLEFWRVEFSIVTSDLRALRKGLNPGLQINENRDAVIPIQDQYLKRILRMTWRVFMMLAARIQIPYLLHKAQRVGRMKGSLS